MHYILGTIFIFGGLALQFGGAESLWPSRLDWNQVAPFLIMATGLAVIVTGGKAIRYKRRMTAKLARAIEKIELLYDHAELSRNDSADADYRQLHDIARLYQASPPLYRGSQLWENLYLRHIRWIKEYGIANFKRSVNLAYFQWKIDFRNNQLVSVMRNVNPAAILRNFLRSASLHHCRTMSAALPRTGGCIACSWQGSSKKRRLSTGTGCLTSSRSRNGATPGRFTTTANSCRRTCVTRSSNSTA